MSLYDDLGVSPDATDDEIAAAYRSAARRHHPDTGGNAEDFDRVQRAANILRDPVKRAEYDRTGNTDDRPYDPTAQAADQLNTAFADAIAWCEDFGAVDMVRFVRRDLEHKLIQLAAQREQATVKRKRLASAIRRLAHKGDGPDFVGSMLAGQLRSQDAVLTDMARMTAALQRAIEMTHDYRWNSETEPEAVILRIAQEAIDWDEIAS